MASASPEPGRVAGAAGPHDDVGVLVHSVDIPIRWGDMDAMGHVNNTVYFRYMEQCRIGWFEALGIPPAPGGEGPVLVSASCNFRRQLEYPGTVRVRQWTRDIGRSSFLTYLEIARTDDPDAVCADGDARVVWVDFPRQKSAPLPPAVREAIARPWVGWV